MNTRFILDSYLGKADDHPYSLAHFISIQIATFFLIVIGVYLIIIGWTIKETNPQHA